MTQQHSVALVSHGTSSPLGRTAVAALVDAVGRRLGDRRVVSGFVDVQQPDLPSTLAGGRGSIVVPLLLSAGYHVHVDMREAVHADASPSVLAAALGPDDRLVDVLARRLREAGLTESDGSDDDVVVLAAAGSSDARAVADCRDMASRLGSALGREVTCAFISAATPRLTDAVSAARRRHPSSRVVVATYLLASGYFADLAAACGADVVTGPLLSAQGVVPEELVDVVVDRCLVAESEALIAS
ncbi:sirohydrochlorin chelatase [Humibacter sp. RRB41]|uniref:sirohydrochlorin chelatase n=1 Tax=Humibacter sp. RRB41 TaxID=2919946 RepID=UPI001FA9BFA6|nr:CbiX/SirB N-terminal domain-containing protein [Humibacter sp. RRB41]